MIIGLIGNMSSGKTVTMNFLSSLFDKPIITNMKVTYKAQYMSFSAFVNKYDQLLGLAEKDRQNALKSMFKGKLWLADEMHNLVNARDFMNRKFNLNTTQLITMLGKLDCDLIYTAQLFDSQIDLRLRELTNIICYTSRIDKNGNELFLKSRILDQKIFIKVKMDIIKDTHVEKREFIFDPEPYFTSYDTEQIIITQRK